MFERATKKLGLDQAIFQGGQFKQTYTDEANPSASTEKKLNKLETEMLLKKGILGFLDNDDDGQNNFFEQNID